MVTFNITLPEDVADIAKEKAAAGGFANTADYLQAMVTNTLDQQSRERLEDLLIEGLESSPPIEVTDEYWQQKKQDLIRLDLLPRAD